MKTKLLFLSAAALLGMYSAPSLSGEYAEFYCKPNNPHAPWIDGVCIDGNRRYGFDEVLDTSEPYREEIPLSFAGSADDSEIYLTYRGENYTCKKQ